MRILVSITAVALVAFSTPAFARHHHARHAHRATANVVVTSPDIFKMPLFGDVADYGPAPTRRVVASVERIERTEHRRVVMSVEPQASTGGSESASRPGDCYGIAWCGCFMRHYKGIADKALNLARNWAHVGSPTSPHSGAVVVWSYHVGELRSEPDAHGYALVYSGNNGSGNRATVRRAYIRNAIAFRQL